jgi:tetratricopeptide (TPR) repeat protein
VRFLIVSVSVLALAASAPAQEQSPSVQQLFEAGQHGRAAQIITSARQGQEGVPAPPPGPADAVLAGQVFLRLNQNDRAKQEFGYLISSADAVWRLTGESAVALVDSDLDRALDLATQAAVQLAADEAAANQAAAAAGTPSVPRTVEAFHVAYQTALVKAARMDWAGAAAEFERATQLQPMFAYAHYYAGLASSNIRRPDQVALHFEHFLNLAPNAPERPAVMSIMRTIRGR